MDNEKIHKIDLSKKMPLYSLRIVKIKCGNKVKYVPLLMNKEVSKFVSLYSFKVYDYPFCYWREKGVEKKMIEVAEKYLTKFMNEQVEFASKETEDDITKYILKTKGGNECTIEHHSNLRTVFAALAYYDVTHKISLRKLVLKTKYLSIKETLTNSCNSKINTVKENRSKKKYQKENKKQKEIDKMREF